MKWIVRLFQLVLVAAFMLFGLYKLSGDVSQVEAFTDTYGYSEAFMYVVGSVEVLCAIGLSVGFWKKNLIAFFSGVLTVIMVGAIYTLVQSDQGLESMSLPAVLLLLSLIVGFGQSKMNKREAKRGY